MHISYWWNRTRFTSFLAWASRFSKWHRNFCTQESSDSLCLQESPNWILSGTAVLRILILVVCTLVYHISIVAPHKNQSEIRKSFLLSGSPALLISSPCMTYIFLCSLNTMLCIWWCRGTNTTLDKAVGYPNTPEHMLWNVIRSINSNKWQNGFLFIVLSCECFLPC